VWGKITKDNPLYDIPEFYEINDFEDITAHFHHTLPPNLTRPAILLSERQRAAKQMTLEYIKKENELIKKRAKTLTEFPVVTKDKYEVQTGLMVVRDPIWLLHDEVEHQYLKIKSKTFSEHGRFPALKSKDLGLKRDPPSGEDDRNTRMRGVLRIFDRKEDIKFTPYEHPSTHWLEADPYETDPRKIAYAGGYRVWLLLKEKSTKKWVFPTVRMFGAHTFEDGLGKITNELLETRILYNILGPYACLCDIRNFEKEKIVNRPRMLSEDVYELYFKRSKILFPDSDDETIEKYLMKRYYMTRNTLPVTIDLKGIKTFYFRAIYQRGVFDLKPESIYSDWAWVPKLEMNKYLTEEDYNSFIRVMSLT
jgi:hypothetical protein